MSQKPTKSINYQGVGNPYANTTKTIHKKRQCQCQNPGWHVRCNSPPPLSKRHSLNARLIPPDQSVLAVLLAQALAIPRRRRRSIAELAAPLRNLGQLGLQAGTWAVHLEPPAALPVWMVAARSRLGRRARGWEHLGMVVEEVVQEGAGSAPRRSVQVDTASAQVVPCPLRPERR